MYQIREEANLLLPMTDQSPEQPPQVVTVFFATVAITCAHCISTSASFKRLPSELQYLDMAIFGRVGHIWSEAVIVELVNSKCLPTLLYGLEACPLKSADLKSLDYTVVGAFMKIFKTKSKKVASCCMDMFNCPLPSVSVNNRKCQSLKTLFVSTRTSCSELRTSCLRKKDKRILWSFRTAT